MYVKRHPVLQMAVKHMTASLIFSTGVEVNMHSMYAYNVTSNFKETTASKEQTRHLMLVCTAIQHITVSD